jgi:putative nucleotidyltransferase with HDIG domain
MDAQAPGDSQLGEYFVRTWALPLRASHLGDPWVVVMLRPKDVVLGPLRRFVRDFWMVLALSILVVTWISLSQVRRHLEPLAALVGATQRLARREFDRPVEVQSGDEFEDLGKAFDGLALELKRQFAQLEAFNLGTLAALGRAIDAKSPWTSGHSERVTRLAVALAEEMQLPADEIEDLRRAGLIHDIGKLATPPGILEKPGSLTPEELRIMREHTLKGVHILEPIPMYERLLPVVGQHHERWDGRGYPHGLAGTAIARTARVLAVADVCDALGSDRPYHRAMAQAEVLEHVRLRSGTQFDPDVVEALVRLTSQARATPVTSPTASPPTEIMPRYASAPQAPRNE